MHPAEPPPAGPGPNPQDGPRRFPSSGPTKDPHAGGPALLAGRYERVRTLGRGAMGEVLDVRDVRSGQRYALKRIPPEVARQPAQMAAVRANFLLVSGLAHPHIAVTRFLEADAAGEVFILMDLVRGVDLQAWLAEQRTKLGGPRSPLPLETAIGIAEQAASALDYAHAQPIYADDGRVAGHGVLHRDLKPANLMAVEGREFRSGVPYIQLVDFGVAAEIQASMSARTEAVEHVNALTGTPLYMAPEQWQGRTLTRAIDQWALAVMIYEIVEGRTPFASPSLVALRRRVLEQEPRTPENLSRTEWEALLPAFNKDRTKRYPSCTSLVQALAAARLAGSLPPGAAPSPLGLSSTAGAADFATAPDARLRLGGTPAAVGASPAAVVASPVGGGPLGAAPLAGGSLGGGPLAGAPLASGLAAAAKAGAGSAVPAAGGASPLVGGASPTAALPVVGGVWGSAVGVHFSGISAAPGWPSIAAEAMPLQAASVPQAIPSPPAAAALQPFGEALPPLPALKGPMQQPFAADLPPLQAHGSPMQQPFGEALPPLPAHENLPPLQASVRVESGRSEDSYFDPDGDDSPAAATRPWPLRVWAAARKHPLFTGLVVAEVLAFLWVGLSALAPRTPVAGPPSPLAAATPSAPSIPPAATGRPVPAASRTPDPSPRSTEAAAASVGRPPAAAPATVTIELPLPPLPAGMPSNSAPPSPPPPPASLPAAAAGPKVLIVTPLSNVWFDDVKNLRAAFDAFGTPIDFASIRPGRANYHPASLPQGSPPPPLLEVPLAVEDVHAGDYLAVVFIGQRTDDFVPGGEGAPQARRLLDEAKAGGVQLASICVGVRVLGSHGVLAGKPAATAPAIDSEVRREGGWTERVQWRNAPQSNVVRAVWEGTSIVTAGSPDDARDLVLSIMKAYVDDRRTPDAVRRRLRERGGRFLNAVTRDRPLRGAPQP